MEQQNGTMGRAANGTVHPVQTNYKPRYVDCSLDNYKSYRSNAFRRLRKRLKRKGVIEVDFDHHRYKILMALRKGIRDLMLSHLQDPRQSHLRVDDFSQVEERQVTRSDGRVFVFESYANNVFLHLRQSLDISEPEFLQSVAPESLPYLEFISNSNSGQKFYLSNDMKYMFKTEKECSIQFFFSILGEYLQHFQAYPHSLLVRFLGLYSIKLPKEKKIYFLVMQSVFYPCDRIQDRFDIKGFTTLRYQKPYHPNKNIITVLKDKNFKDEVIDMGSQKSWFQKQLAMDVEFLRTQGVQDYSLLVGRQLHRHTPHCSSLSTVVRRVSRSLQPTAGFFPSSWASKATSTTTLSHKSSTSVAPQHAHSRQSLDHRAQTLHPGAPSLHQGDTESDGTLQTPRMKSAVSASAVGNMTECCEATRREGTPDLCLACHLATRREWRGETSSLRSGELGSGDLQSDCCLDCQSMFSSEEELSECEMQEACACGGCSGRNEMPVSVRTSDTPRSQSAPESSSVVLEELSPGPKASGSFPERSISVPDTMLSIPGKPSHPPQNSRFVRDKCVPPADGVSVTGAGKPEQFKVVRKNGFVPSLEDLAISEQAVVVERNGSEMGDVGFTTRTAAETDKSQNRRQLAVPGSRASSGRSDRSAGRNSVVTSLVGTPREPGDSCPSAMPAVECHGHQRRNSEFDAVADGDPGTNSNHNNHHTMLTDSSPHLDKTEFCYDHVCCQAKSGSQACYKNGNITSNNATPADQTSSPLRAGAACRDVDPASVCKACSGGRAGRVCSHSRPDCRLRRLPLRARGGGDCHRCHAAWGHRPPRIFLPYPQSLHVLNNARLENRRLLPACENALHIMDGPKYRYYLGIIDFFTRFECRQRVGGLLHCCKRFDLFYSAVDPEAYAQRFLRFIDDHLK